MITAVDSNVLIDVLEPDPTYGPSSKAALSRCLAEGNVTACEVVWAEVGTAYGNKQKALLEALEMLGIGFSAITQDAALEASRHWHTYRKRAGARRRIVADFLIGAHAMVQCDRLLSRDRGFYRESYRALKVIDPSR